MFTMQLAEMKKWFDFCYWKFSPFFHFERIITHTQHTNQSDMYYYGMCLLLICIVYLQLHSKWKEKEERNDERIKDQTLAFDGVGF